MVPVYNGVGTAQYTIIEPVETYNMADNIHQHYIMNHQLDQHFLL